MPDRVTISIDSALMSEINKRVEELKEGPNRVRSVSDYFERGMWDYVIKDRDADDSTLTTFKDS